MRWQITLFVFLFSLTAGAVEDPAAETASAPAATAPATAVPAAAPTSNFVAELRGAGQSQVCPQAEASPQDARYQELIDEAKKGLQTPGGTH